MWTAGDLGLGLCDPGRLIAVVAGTALIFVAEVFGLWLIAKLAFVSVMVMAHAWIGPLIEQSGVQRQGQGVDPTRGYRMPIRVSRLP